MFLTVILTSLSLIAAPYNRDFQSLDGQWSAIIDQYETGTGKGIYIDKKPEGKTDFIEFSWDGAMKLDVPGDWNHQRPELWWYEGTIWYSRHFNTEKEPGRRKLLYFAGVSCRCDVYLNGQKVATHEGAFTPFQADVTDIIMDGDNFIAVRVNNNRLASAIPAMSFDWWNYGGITREVMLITLPETYIDTWFIRLSGNSSKTVEAEVQLSSNEAGRKITIEIPELGIRKSALTGADGKASAEFKAPGLKLWSPGQPVLYSVRLSSGEDSVEDEIGFRQIATDGTKVLLNGNPVFLRCISFHEEIAKESRRAWSEKDAEELTKAAAALGCNMIRLAHYPQNEHIVRMAERMGLMIWEEIPLWQGIDFTSGETYGKADRYLTEMIARDRNRCAICFWSISNETRPGKDRDAFLTRLLARGKELDSSRLFTSAFDVAYYIKEAGEFQMKDSFASLLDVIGINKYMGWYAPWPDDPENLRWNVFPGKPLIISEFGCEAKYGRYGNADTASSWSEDYQAELFKKNLAMFRNIDNLTGISPWILYDFRSPYRQHPANQDFFNRKGLLSENGERKKAWYIIHDYYNEKK